MSDSLDAYNIAEQYAQQTNRCMFITGKAGTGKTTFLRHLRENTIKNMVVVAPTGVAAINAGGVTIHSFFQLPLRIFLPTPQSYQQLFSEQRILAEKRNVFYHLDLLVIDEISMVRADLLDAIDMVLRHYRRKLNIPFGGVQVIFIGDLFQLSPVVKREEQQLLNKYYKGPYFFQSNVMQQIKPIYIELNHVFRQQNIEFVRLLNEVRDNCLTERGKALLDSRYIPDFKNDDKDFHITLTTHNLVADEINSVNLDKLESKQYDFKAIVRNNFPESNYPNDEVLHFKVGARVIFIKNDEEAHKRFYNGKTGVITEIRRSVIVVDCGEKKMIEVTPVTWENIRYTEDELTSKIEEEVLGTFTQYPLRLAWAITIHKSQGLTFDKVIIDAARAFASGQVYVALSRCRTLDGIVLTTSLTQRRIDNDHQVIDYTLQQPLLSEVEGYLVEAINEYVMIQLVDLFDFRKPYGIIEQMQLTLQKPSFNKLSKDAIDSLDNQFYPLVQVAEKFQVQLQHIVVSDDLKMLRERIEAAYNYFSPKLQKIIDEINTTPCRSKNKEDASEMLQLMQNLYLVLSEKLYSMDLAKGFTDLKTYQIGKSKFAAKPMKLNSLYEVPAKKESVKQLIQRTLLGDDYDIFPELSQELDDLDVLRKKDIYAITHALPQNETELAQINVLSSYVIEVYGDEILQIVNDFISKRKFPKSFVKLMHNTYIKNSEK